MGLFTSSDPHLKSTGKPAEAKAEVGKREPSAKTAVSEKDRALVGERLRAEAATASRRTQLLAVPAHKAPADMGADKAASDKAGLGKTVTDSATVGQVAVETKAGPNKSAPTPSSLASTRRPPVKTQTKREETHEVATLQRFRDLYDPAKPLPTLCAADTWAALSPSDRWIEKHGLVAAGLAAVRCALMF